MVWKRKHWHQQWEAQGRLPTQRVPLGNTRCAYCTFVIGYNYAEHELYLCPELAPAGAKAALVWKYACGVCATRTIGLRPGFCLVHATDWKGLLPLTAAKLAQLTQLRQERQRALAPLIARAWNPARRQLPTLVREQTRQELFAQVRSLIDPPVVACVLPAHVSEAA